MPEFVSQNNSERRSTFVNAQLAALDDLKKVIAAPTCLGQSLKIRHSRNVTALGRIEGHGWRGRSLMADYVLE